MPQPKREWTADMDRRLLRLRKAHNLKEAARRMGISAGSASERLAILEGKEEPIEVETEATVEGDQLTEERKGDGREFDLRSTDSEVCTLAGLIARCQLDLTVWEEDRVVLNKWDVGAKGPDGKLRTTPLYQIKAWFKRNAKTETAHRLLELFDVSVKEGVPSYTFDAIPTNGHLGVMPLPDAHFGKLCWAPEVGENYDLDIAEALWKESAGTMLPRLASYGIDVLILLVGNDFINTDNVQGATTAGTPQDNDGRPWKVIHRAALAFVWLIHEAKRHVEKVKVLGVPGNHDALTSYMIALFLSAWFKDDDRVEVDIQPAGVKYVEFGANLIGFLHGDQIQLTKLPLMMAQDVPETWGRTQYREWLTGHVHHESSKDHQGVIVRTCKSLAAQDAWHRKKGYMSRRGAEAWVYHPETGPCGHLIYNVPPRPMPTLRLAA